MFNIILKELIKGFLFLILSCGIIFFIIMIAYKYSGLTGNILNVGIVHTLLILYSFDKAIIILKRFFK